METKSVFQKNKAQNYENEESDCEIKLGSKLFSFDPQ